MTDQAALHDKVLEAIRTGKLPDGSPRHVWAGPSCGASCVICGERINVDEIELELEFGAGDDGELPYRYRVHLGCYAPRESERLNPQIGPNQTGTATELSAAVGDTRIGADERQASREEGDA